MMTLIIGIILILFGLIQLYTITLKKVGYIFNIKYNNHYSILQQGLWIPRFHNKKKPLKFTAQFGKGCLYEVHGPDRDDINKLYGYSTGFHLRDSVRIGWRGIDGFIELFAFIHENGNYIYQSFGRYDVDTVFRCEISETDSLYHLKVNESNIQISKDNDKIIGWLSYILKPYFGGNLTAPKDMQIRIEEL